MQRRLLLPMAHWCVAGLAALVVACGPPAAAVVQEEDPRLLQEVVRRQEQRVAEARAELAKLERELRLAQMRRRMLERAGRHDLAAAMELEEYGIQHQLGAARRALANEDDALAIYRHRGERRASGP